MNTTMPTSLNITVPDKCTGLELADGTKYDAHNNKVQIDNPRHAKAWVKDGNSALLGRQQIIGLSHLTNKTNECPTCGFAAWHWTKTCPKCDTVLKG